MTKKNLRIAMFGQKHMMSREGGVEIVVKELATRMSQRGHKMVVYDRSSNHVSGDTSLDKRREVDGVKIIPVWTVNKKGLAAMTSSLFAALRATISSADVIHIHAEGPAAMSFIPKIRRKRVIVTIHGLDWQRAKWSGFATKYIKWGERQAVKYADEIIVLSRGVQDYFKLTYGRDTVYIPNGVNKPEKKRAELISKLWGLEKDNYVLFLGRIVPEKGLNYLINAWKDIKTDKKLVIVGGSSDTEEFMNQLRQSTSECKNSIIFTGFQQGQIIEELYSNAYIYCLPSDLEGMPLSLLEALSYGNCCLVSDIPECKEVVEDKAVTFSHGDENDLKIVLQDLLGDREKVQDYKNTAAKYVLNKYSWDDVVDRTLELYYNN